jgi:uncharacterized protein
VAKGIVTKRIVTKGRAILLLAAGAVLLGSSPAAWALGNHPDWCDEQGSKVAAERTICATKSLWMLDDNLNVAYEDALGRVGGRRGQVQSAQREWVRVTRNGCGGDVACLTAVYNRRIRVLEGTR